MQIKKEKNFSLMQVPVEQPEVSRRDTSRRLGLGLRRLCGRDDTWLEQKSLQVRNGRVAHHRLALLQ